MRKNNSKKELFDMVSDLREKHNIINKEKAIADQLENLLENHLKRIEKETPTISQNEIFEDEQIKIKLRGLGYFD